MIAATPDLPAAVAEALDRLAPPGLVGLAVSGGGDSMALMRLAALWARDRGRALAVAAVDHNLRPEAAAEAATVCAQAAALGLPSQVLTWAAPAQPGWRPAGNLQQAAREARARLLADWAADTGAAAIATGHTADDQAETVLMRLARGSGVDGLSGMAPRTVREGVLWLRPLLTLRRAALRDWLQAQGATWMEDPSNEDPRFDRVKARAALRALAPLGLTTRRLAATATRMARARAALDAAATALWTQAGRIDACGTLWLARAALRAAPEDTAARLLIAALGHVGGRRHRPRAAASLTLLRAAMDEALGAGRTLAGCILGDAGPEIWIAREPARIAASSAPKLFDGRWRVAATATGTIGALGSDGEAQLAAASSAGWQAAPAWRAAPRPARLATPALWRDDVLICAPCAGFGAGLTVTLAPFAPAGAAFDTGPCVE